MEIADKVWGTHDIDEPVLIELMNSEPMQRLKGVSHYGPPAEFYSVPGFSRYEHSLGVMLALRYLGAGVEEQAAGLLHDASHTAFSHVIDFVVGSGDKDDYQDNRHRKVIEDSELPAILHKHGIQVEPLITLDSFSLLESPAPGICADRLDYSMREFAYWSAPQSVGIIKDGLKNDNGRIVFLGIEPARRFGKEYMNLQRNHWAGPDAVIRYHLLAKVLKTAFEERIINIKDLNRTDDEIISKLKASSNEMILSTLQKLRKNSVNEEIAAPNAPGAIRRVKKFRYVDPPVYCEKTHSFRPLSELDNQYRELLSEVRENTAKGIWIQA